MSAPTPIPFGEWAPDLSDRANPTAEAKGCISQEGQYGPLPDIQDYGPASQVDAFTRVLLHMDGTDAGEPFLDSASSPHTFTGAGNAQTSIAQFKFGGSSLELDGTGDWISTLDSSDFTLGSGDWTVDFWFNCTAAGGTVQRLFGQCDAAISAASLSVRIQRTTSNTINVAVGIGSTSFELTGTTQFTDAVNTGWNHCAVVRTGSFLRMFINGLLEGADTITKVLLHMDGADAGTTFTDSAQTPNTFTAAGNAQLDTAQSKFGGASGLFDGTGDWISAADSANFTLGSGDWTIDLWFNCSAAGGTKEAIAGQMASGLAAATGAWYIERHTTNVIRAHVSNGSALTTVTGTTTITATGWHHCALVRTGDILRLFIDGVQEGGDVAFTGSVNDSGNALRIGAAGEDTNDPWTGWLDEFRLSVGAARWTTAFTPPTAAYVIGELQIEGAINNSSDVLSVGQAGAATTTPWAGYIDEFHLSVGTARWTANFTSPSSAWTADGFSKILLHCDQPTVGVTFQDDAPTPHTFARGGNAQIDTAQSKFGGASLLLDGTGDYISTPDAADLELAASDFTADVWFNCNAAGGDFRVVVGKTTTGSTGVNADRSFIILRTTANVIAATAFVGSSAFQVTGTTQFTNAVNTGWHHVAFVRTGNTLRLFIDGVQEGGDVAITGSVNDLSGPLSVGRSGDESFGADWLGWVDEFRLSIGIARWTANFTPPANPYHFGAGAEDVVLGADTFYDSATAPHIFFGDDDRLYTLESRMAVDASKAGGYSLLSTDTWQFAQFGDNVVAVARSEAPQRYIMGTSVDFANLGGSPPSGATSVARVNDFLMMGKDFTVHWSAFNDIADWTPSAATQAGNQELDQERGQIISIIGLDFAAIFQERGVRRASYVGPPVIWDFGQDYIEKARGCIARNAATAFGRIIYYAADDGFYAFDGVQSTPIGAGKVDNYFTRNLNYAYRHKISVGIDYTRKLIVWACPMGSSQLPSKLLIFSVQDGRWTYDDINVEFLFDSPAEPFTVDNFSTLFPEDNLDGAISPDDIDSSVFDDRRIRLAAFQATDHQLGMFTGSARPATIETVETELSPGRRALVTEVWPLGDMQEGAVSASVGYRNALPGASKVYTNASAMNRAGFCPQRIDARFGSVRLQIAAAANWRRMEGVHVTAVPTGGR